MFPVLSQLRSVPNHRLQWSIAHRDCTMSIPPHVKCCGCCCSLHNGTAIGTGLYIAYLLLAGVVLPVVFWPEDVEQAKAFCAGTTPAYRQGNDINSALTRQSLCARRSAQPAPDPASLPGVQATTCVTAPTSAPTTGTRWIWMPARVACTA